MDAVHWPQGLGQLKPMEEMLMGASSANLQQQVQGSNPNPPLQASQSSALAAAPGGGMTPAMSMAGGGAGAGSSTTERRARPQKEKAINCPRCNSTNTKFCYYNNYSLQQPRYFCKTCRRYWTEGGSLRNVPVGGGSRKNKRSSSSSLSSSSASAASISVASSSMSSNKNPKLAHEGAAHDLNLAFPHHHQSATMQQHAQAEYMAFPSLESGSMCSNPAGGGGAMGSRTGGGALSAMELLRSTGCYMPLQMPIQMPGDYGAAGFTLGEFRPPQSQAQPQSLLGFSLDAHGSAGGGASSAGYGGSSTGMQGMQQDRAGRLLFPFEDLKPTASSGAPGGGETGGGGGGGSGAGVDGGHHQFEQGNKEQQGNGAPAGGQHDTPVFWNGMIGGGTSW